MYARVPWSKWARAGFMERRRATDARPTECQAGLCMSSAIVAPRLGTAGVKLLDSTLPFNV